jgi:hypothetical protein
MFAPTRFDREKLEAFCNKRELIVAEAKRDLNSTIVYVCEFGSRVNLYNQTTSSESFGYEKETFE